MPDKVETRGKIQEILAARSLFDPSVFKIRDGVPARVGVHVLLLTGYVG